MSVPTRRNFLGLAQKAVAAAAVGAIGVRCVAVAEAMPVTPDLGQAGTTLPDLVTPAQWGPGWGPPPRRRRRWVCWRHRGRRRCGWRWV
jgi:hypothetical protein